MPADDERKVIGIIGGSGLYSIEGLQDLKEESVTTPFGEPSDAYITGTIDATRVVFLPRHGKGHHILPSEINFRANIYGMKMLGVNRIISVGAVGSMKEHIKPGSILIPDQYIDLTKRRASTFFGNGIVAHVSMAAPACPSLAKKLYDAGKRHKIKMYDGGTYLCIEGPQFSSKAESNVYRQWGVDVIGMTGMPEAKLAREAEICYATLALVTDFDCWYEGVKDVEIGDVLKVMNENTANAKKLIRSVISGIEEKRTCACAHALKDSIITARENIPRETKESLSYIIKKYIQ